jgi:transcription elongation factor GreA
MAIVHHLSKASFDRLTAEYEDLTTRGRHEIAEKIQRAREMGDLSENGDYQAAKDEQGMMEGRVRQLKQILDNSEIVEADGSVAAPGTLVTIVYEGDREDDAETYLIGSLEERHEHDVITPGSPLGAALLGSGAGAQVEYEANGRTLRATIVDVRLP